MFKKVFNYITDFIEKCVYYFKNDEVYRQKSKNIFFCFLLISVLLLLIGYFVDELDTFNYIMFSLIICIFWIVIWAWYSFFVVPSDYIEPNIDKLPAKIWKYPVIVEYNLPKGLNPSEVWMLYNKAYESTNVSCMIYKWENEWLLRMDDRWDGSYILHRYGEIDNDVPGYERRYWTVIFWHDRKQEVRWSEKYPSSDLIEWGYVHIEILKYCKEKWWLIEENDFKWLWIMLIAFLINPIILFVWLLIYFIYKGQKSWDHMINPFKKIFTTDKWDELMAQIIWYKYWLERCEEEQMRKILEDDPWFKSRNFPYVVALRMNRRLLGKNFYN